MDQIETEFDACSVIISSPGDGACLNLTPQYGDGDSHAPVGKRITVTGKVTGCGGVYLQDVKVATSSEGPIPFGDACNSGASVTPDPITNVWTHQFNPVGTCAHEGIDKDGANWVTAVARWSTDPMGMDEFCGGGAQCKFTGKFHNACVGEEEGGEEDQVKCSFDKCCPTDVSRRWISYSGISAQMAFHGVQLFDRNKKPLRARRLLAYAPAIDWRMHDVPTLRIRKAIGNYRTTNHLNPQLWRFPSCPQGCIVLHQLNTKLENPRSSVVHAVVADRKRDAQAVELDPDLPVFVKLNVYRYGPSHSGEFDLRVRIVD